MREQVLVLSVFACFHFCCSGFLGFARNDTVFVRFIRLIAITALLARGKTTRPIKASPLDLNRGRRRLRLLAFVGILRIRIGVLL